jgi:hypothetical protein
VFGSLLRTEDFYYNVSIILRTETFITYKGEISRSNLSGYGLAILGATPNISWVSHRHIDNDMRAIEALDNFEACMDPFGYSKSQVQCGKDVRLLGSSAGDPAQTEGSAKRTRSCKIRLARSETMHMMRNQDGLFKQKRR